MCASGCLAEIMLKGGGGSREQRGGEGVNLLRGFLPASGLYVQGACSVFPGVSMLSQRPL